MTDSPEQGEAQTACAEVERVLQGLVDVELGAPTMKMVHIVTGSPCDVLLVPYGPVEVQFLSRPKGRPHTYVPRVGPGLVADVMRGLGVRRVVAPIVGVLAEATERGPFRRWPLAAWVVPEEGRLVILLREATGSPPMAAMAIPSDGPWALPSPVPPAAPREKRWVESGRACPHCGEHPETFRVLRDAWVCEVCGRSFPSRGVDGA